MRGSFGLTRRSLLAVGVSFAALSFAQAAERAPERAGRLRPIDRRRRILIRNATIIRMDGNVEDLARGDILIEGSKIIEIGRFIPAAGARVIDASGMIAFPGFVDCHRHSWEGQLRRINPNAETLAEYSNATHLSFATAYRPQDIYAGNYLTAIGCIDSGITCVIDNSHNSRSAAHSDAAVEALLDSGIRGVHASGAPQVQDKNYDRQWPGDLERLQRKYFSGGESLVTLRMFSPPNRENWALARRLGLRITTEFQGQAAAEALDALWVDHLVGPDNTFNHCGALPQRTWDIFRQSGASVNVCPRSDAQYGLGEGIAPYQQALDYGLKPAFSIDNETSYSTDMFTEMRVVMMMQRALVQNRRFRGETNLPPAVMARDVLASATLNGAICAGLGDKTGRLAPGFEADIVLIRSGDLNLYPSNNAIGTVVQAADRSNIDTVIIGGRVRKFGGRMAGLDTRKLRRVVEESRGYLFRSIGYKEDLFAEKLPKLY